MLKSRFTQITMVQEAAGIVSTALLNVPQNPERMSRALGKAFYQELHKAGFDDDHIISVATEVIGL